MIARLALAAVALAFGTSAAAHETTLLPSRFQVAPGEPIVVSLSSMAEFPVFETGPRPARVNRAAAYTGKGHTALEVGAHAPDALRFSFTPTSPGLAVLAVSLSPHNIDLAPDKIAEYFDEIDPPASVRAALAPGAMLHETYTKYAKAIVCVQPCRNAPGSQSTRLLGDALEFAPLGDHSRRFILLARNAAAVDVAVTVWWAGRHETVRTDRAGQLVLPIDARGPTMLSATILRPPASPGARFTSDFATLTFNAR